MQFTLAHQEGKLTAKVERNVKNLRGGCLGDFSIIHRKGENRLYEIREVLDAVSEYPKGNFFRKT